MTNEKKPAETTPPAKTDVAAQGDTGVSAAEEAAHNLTVIPEPPAEEPAPETKEPKAPKPETISVKCDHDGVAPGIAEGPVQLFKGVHHYAPEIAAAIVKRGMGATTQKGMDRLKALKLID